MKASHLISARPPAAPLPHSLAASLAAGAHPTTLLFPGIDADWPRLLAEAVVGRTWLSDWVDAVAADLDRWSRTPEVRRFAPFPDGFSDLVRRSPDEPVSPYAGTGPAILVGNLLTNLASLAALDAEGLSPATTAATTRAAGHSAGLLAAWVAAGARAEDGLLPLDVAAGAARIAAIAGMHAQRHPWSVSDSAVAAALAGRTDAATPMVAISGPRTARLRAALERLVGDGGRVSVAVRNSPTRHVLSGDPRALADLRTGLAALASADARLRSTGQLGGPPFQFTWEPLPSSAAFHHPDLSAAAAAALAHIEDAGLALPRAGAMPVIDPATGRRLSGSDALAAIVTSVLAREHDWVAAVPAAVDQGGVAIMVSALGSLAGVSRSILQGRGALVLDPAAPADRTKLFTSSGAPAIPKTYDRYAPRVVRGSDGALRLDNRHTRLSGRSPVILPGMTPSTAEAPIVAAAANGGHVAELAGGGQVSERILTERIAELCELLDPGHEVVVNALHLDPYLWDLQLGRDRLVQRARAAGAPINGVTISAGIPDRREALALLDELNEAGIWLNAFKPGTVAQVKEALSIAAETAHPVWIHLEGGAAGGHHSWEDLDELLLATYHLVREHENVVLAAGGGVAEPARAAALLTGTWAHPHGAPTMPVDAVLLGTVTMATRESGASPSVKAALVQAAGHPGWVRRGEVRGATTSGRSGLDADIHFLDNSASRAARLLDEVAGDAGAVAARRDEIINVLAATAKPYFGDVEEMTYAEMLGRFIELTALGRHGRYEDGAWLDRTHRTRFIALLQQAEARLHPTDSGPIPTSFAEPTSVDDPAAALELLCAAHATARTALLHPADVAHFLAVARRPGKPVPFVPVIDADVRRWYQSDALWQSHSDLFEADQVLIIPGPTAVAGITAADEPVAEVLDRFESAVAEAINGQGHPVLESCEPGFRLGRTDAVGASHAEQVLAAALAAPTWRWLAASRPNPLHRIGPASQWSIRGRSAVWGGSAAESATISVEESGALALTVTWPGLGLPGDGFLTLPVAVDIRSGVISFAVEESGLAAAGARLLELLAAGGAASDPAMLAASHAATVGATGALPDHLMAVLWPSVFAALAEAGQAPAIFDLVHLRHELIAAGSAGAPGGAEPVGPERPTGGARAVEPPTVEPPMVERPVVERTDGGLIITVASAVEGVRVTDRFFVRRAAADPDLPVARPLVPTADAIVGPAASAGPGAPAGERAVPTPVLTLGTLTVAAPSSLATFATVSGDANPIHRSDVLARFVGLPGRIVHGMWTSAAATRAVVEHAAGGDPGRLRGWAVDFLTPLLPGEPVAFTVARVAVRAGARVVRVEARAGDRVVAIGTALVAPPRTVYVFPGQGIQGKGMGMDAYARSAAARSTWDRADAITRERLGFSVLEVVRENPTSIAVRGVTYRHPAGVLNLTQFTQVAMAALASAQVAQLREQGVFDPDAAVAGHSVGEYNALAACSGVLPLEAVIELVFARGLAMHGLVPRDAEGRSDYRLAVIRPHLVGMTHAQAELQVAAVAADTGQLCQIVNHNLRGKQYAVAGTVQAIAELSRRLGEGRPGRPPIVAVPGLDVPFHSSALLGGVDGFRGHLRATLPPRIRADVLVGRYVPNLYPRVFALDRAYVEGVLGACDSPVLAELLADWEAASADRDALARTLLVELLAWQFASPVRWIETFELMCTPVEQGGLGVERVVEVGLGSAPTLANLAKGSLALASHRGTRPHVLHVEVDAGEVLETTGDASSPGQVGVGASDASQVLEVGLAAASAAAAGAADAPAASAAASAGAEPASAGASGGSASSSRTPADLPVDHATALRSLLAMRVGVRPGQLDDDSIESLVDGASSRRNQVLMDIGREFGVPAIDGAHELPLADLAAEIAGRAPAYRYPGPVLGSAVEGALTAALGPLGASGAALAKRVAAHWGLATGWTDRAGLALALGTRDGSSRRGGELATLAAPDAQALVDAAVREVAAAAGLAVAPAAAARASGGTVDAAAVIDLRDHVEDLLAEQASETLARLGRLPGTDAGGVDPRDEAQSRLAVLESEHGAVHLVAPAFDARRHVLLASATAWARADVDHLVQASLAPEAGDGHGQPSIDVEALVEHISVHRQADPRIATTLSYHRERAASAGRFATVALIDRVLASAPVGVAVPGLAGLRRALAGDPDVDELLAVVEQLAGAPGPFGDQVALVTGASPGSIAWSTVAHLLRGGAKVVVVTTSDTPERIAAYRDLERRCAGVGAELHIIRANLASFADIDALIEWLVTPTVESSGPSSREVKPALWPTLVLPFAAAPAGGALPDTGGEAQLTLRLLLLGVQRLVGRLAERLSGHSAPRDGFTVILPMSPNHGTFGGDGAYGEAKAALETMTNRWHAEASSWGSRTRLISAEIGWVRGTGLMSANDRLAARIEDELGVATFAAEQMGAMVAALATPQFSERTAAGPVRVDLTGGLGRERRGGPGGRLSQALARAVAKAGSADAQSPSDASPAQPTIAALPSLPDTLARARAPIVRPDGPSGARVPAEDMIVMVGIAEYGPWGGSATRWQAELGELGAAGIVELAWRCGLIAWDRARGGWTDVGTGEAVTEAGIAQRYRPEVTKRCGMRQLENTSGVAAEGYWEYAEVHLDRALRKVVPSRAEALDLAASTAGAVVTRADEGWTVTLPAGAAVRVPRRRPLRRTVGGQFPTGSDPARHGLEASVAASMDPLAAWNVVITADALADAGVTPEELVAAVHPSLVGNTQGTGMGGMSSINALYMGPATGRHPANDILQEALGNVVSAHVNQGLVGGYGPMVHPVAACATAAVSLEEAIDKIALGKAEVVIGGGWDDLATEGINGFAAMGATADNDALISAGLAPDQHSRPGDRRRRGFVEAQGGGSFVVCRGSVALALGLPVRAVVGYAATFGDGIHTSIPAPGLGALGAARGGGDSPLGRALSELGLTADDIAVVSKHDTSTQANDPNEAFIHDRIQVALGRTPGAPLRVISQKSLTGHAKGGAAAWQLAGLCDVLATGWVPGNSNLVSVDPDVTPGQSLVVDYRPLRRHEPVRAALATSLGFGHVSAVVALAHPDVFVAAIPPDRQEDYLRAARARRVAGSMRRLRAMHGGGPVLVRRTDRRLGEGSPAQARQREAAMLLAADGRLPGARPPASAAPASAAPADAEAS